ncbi:MAG: bifunctional 3-(3-hydroxy-phenyl)propionate/3-hydroxycinnamic acid hydroxylase [Myxococcota bacterium]
MTSPDFDVAIVGYGPVGAFSALLLAEADLRVAILERSTEPVVLPRAIGLDGESMRAFQRIGLSGAIDKILQPQREREEYCFTDSRRRPLFGVELPGYGHNGWRDNAFFDQPELEALLREHVARNDRIEVLFGREVVALAPSPQKVVLSLAPGSGGADRELSASFVLGCDGASSFVRSALAIDWVSLGYDQDWLVVDITLRPEGKLPLSMMQVCDPERLTTYVPARDPNRRWEFQVLEGETREEMLRPETIEALLQPWLPPEHYDIRRSAVYQFHAATAERLRVDRIFLAGDSAHQTPPFLGQGLNSGFRDAVNLGWKIPLVHSGKCHERLLDSYAAERDLHARDLVERAVAIGQLMETLAAREAGRPDPYASVARRDIPAGGQVVPPLRGGLLVGSQIREGGPVGRLLRQPTVRQSGRSPCRLDSLLGRGFAVVGRQESDLQPGPEANAVLDRLGARQICLEGMEVVKGEGDLLFETHPVAVVRPDRYVFGVVDESRDLDSLLTELGRQLLLR